jgi:hypothetical protein
MIIIECVAATTPVCHIMMKHPDGAVMVCEINEVNDRPVGKPQEQGVMNIAASFSLSKKPRLSIQ